MSKSSHSLEVFDKWSRELAYVLGWALTDASVENNKNRFVVSWQLKDKEPLEIFKQIFKIERDIEFCERKQGDYYRLRIHGRETFDNFMKFGIGPNKSLTVELPEIPEEFKSHFFRGVFEGDGSLWWRFPDSRYKTKMLIASICSGSYNFIKSCYDILPYGRFSNKKSSSVYRIMFYSSNAKNFLDWIYQDSEGLRLSRKYNRYTNGKNEDCKYE